MADNKVVDMKGHTEERKFVYPPMQTPIQREEVAAQVVAVMRAKFARPDYWELLDILQAAEQQVHALKATGDLK